MVSVRVTCRVTAGPLIRVFVCFLLHKQSRPSPLINFELFASLHTGLPPQICNYSTKFPDGLADVIIHPGYGLANFFSR